MNSLLVPIPFLGDLHYKELGVLNELISAHQVAARDNQNASKDIAVYSSMASGSLINGFVSGIASTGGPHGPFIQARSVLKKATRDSVQEAISSGLKIPGFGNSFHRNGVDPAFSALDTFIAIDFPKAYDRVYEIRKWIIESGKKVWPNAAMYTACVCDIVKYPEGLECLLFYLARMPVWAQTWMQVKGAEKKLWNP